MHTHHGHLQCRQMLLDKDVLQLLYLHKSSKKKKKGIYNTGISFLGKLASQQLVVLNKKYGNFM